METRELGSFQIGERIGAGAWAVVHCAEHVQTGVEAALKIVRADDAPVAREDFRREVRAQARLTHRRVAELFAYGEVGEAADVIEEVGPSSPYVAMELADGTVRDAMPLEQWSDAWAILEAILEGLAHTHARGLVHRDLKPENLLVVEGDGRRDVKLGDFGFAFGLSAEERESTDASAGELAGTPRYMAPEQIESEWRRYGPSTDLYAVGCLAYEFVCGRPAFEAESPYEYAIAHCTADRPELDPQFPVPEGVGAWIGRLLRIDPEGRFGRAADALAELRSRGDIETEDEDGATGDSVFLGAEVMGGGREGDRQVPSTWRPDPERRRSARLVGTGLELFGLRETPFIDRERERDALWEELRAVDTNGAEETLRCAFVSGAAGTGKSRLAEWLARRAHELGAAEVFRATHDAGGGADAGVDGMLRHAFRTWGLDRSEVHEHLVDVLPPLDSREAGIEEDARALTELLRPVEEDVPADGPSFRFSSVRQRRALVVRTLHRFARRRPVVFWIDDLQWGAEVLGLLEYLAERRREAPPLFVVATIRSDIVAERPEFERRFEAVSSQLKGCHVDLEPLGRKNQRALLEVLLPLDDELSERLAARTEGHPLFALELLRHWIETGRLETGPDGFGMVEEGDLELPSDLHDLWLERIERLADTLVRDRQAGRARGDVVEPLELAATLGREVDEAEWSRGLELAGLEPAPGLLETMVERGLAEQSEGVWRFGHALLTRSLREHARADGRLADHHRSSARVLESGRDDGTPKLMERIGEHWMGAGEFHRALGPFRRAWERYRDRDARSRSRQVLERREEALRRADVGGRDLPALEQRLLEATQMFAEGERSGSHELIVDLWDDLDETVADEFRSHVATVRARVGTQVEGLAYSRKWSRRAVEIAERSGDSRAVARAERRLGWAEFRRGDFEAVERHAERGLEASREAGDGHLAIQLRRLQARAAFERDREEGKRRMARVRRDAAEAGFYSLEARALNGLAEHARFNGEFERARRLFQQQVDIYRRIGADELRSDPELNRAQVEAASGNYERVRELLERVAERFRGMGVEGARPTIRRLLRVVVAAGEGDEERLETEFERFEAEWSEGATLYADYPWLLRHAGEACAERGANEWARRLWERAAELWEAYGDEDSKREVRERIDDVRDDEGKG